MAYFTSNTYQMKREILTFSNKFSRKLPKPERKFIAEMNYGILASKAACLRILLTSSMKLPKKSTLLTAFHTTLPRGLRGSSESLPHTG
mgnify:CR=1 FL=1